MLAQSGYQVCAVAKSAQGLERFAQGGVDLVLFGSVAARYAGDRVITRLKIHNTGFAPDDPLLAEATKSSLNPYA